MDLGKVYRSPPESVVVEYNCGGRRILTRSETTCEWCGADHPSTVREKLAVGQPEDGTTHPWRYTGDREDTGGLPY